MDRTQLAPAAVTMTAAAGVLHVAAALSHRDVSLLLAAAFLAVAAIQLAVVATARRWPDATLEVLVGTNLAAVGAWAVSRTVGLPLVAVGVEPVGLAGLVTVALQLAAVGLVLLAPRWQALSRRLASAAVVASLGAVAVAVPGIGHAHDDTHAHSPTDDADGTVAVVRLGPGDFEGDTDLSRAANAERMRALMTGEVQPIVITSDGRLLGADSGHAGDDALAEALAAHVDGATGETAEDADDAGHPHPNGTDTHGH